MADQENTLNESNMTSNMTSFGIEPELKRRRPDEQILELPVEKLATSLLSVNNDCLQEIFQHLPLSDLCTLAEVCVQLKTASQQFFSHKYTRKGNKTFNLLKVRGVQMKTTLTEVRSVLSNFGEPIVWLNVDYSSLSIDKHNEYKLLMLISKYCKNLTEFTMSEFTIKSNDIEKWKPFFANLNSLTIIRCKFVENSMNSFISICSKLKYLKLYSVRGCTFDWPKFLNLETIKFHHCDLLPLHLTKFIQLNEMFNKLSIINCQNLLTVDFREISNLKNLKEFEMRTSPLSYENIDTLGNIKTLEKLTVECSGFSISSLIAKLVANNVPIECLRLANSPVDDQMIDYIAQLKGIKVLKLDYMLDIEGDHLVTLAKRLTSLEELSVKNSETPYLVTSTTLKMIISNAKKLTCLKVESERLQIDDETYDQILEILKNRSERSKLDFTIYGGSNQQLVASAKIKENAGTLSISVDNPHFTYFFRNIGVDMDTDNEFDMGLYVWPDEDDDDNFFGDDNSHDSDGSNESDFAVDSHDSDSSNKIDFSVDSDGSNESDFSVDPNDE